MCAPPVFRWEGTGAADDNRRTVAPDGGRSRAGARASPKLLLIYLGGGDPRKLQARPARVPGEAINGSQRHRLNAGLEADEQRGCGAITHACLESGIRSRLMRVSLAFKV